jgi:hypothetical protein
MDKYKQILQERYPNLTEEERFQIIGLSGKKFADFLETHKAKLTDNTDILLLELAYMEAWWYSGENTYNSIGG